MNMICTLVIMLPGGYRDVVDIRGIDLDKDHLDTYLVDFTEDLKKRGYAKYLTQTVLRVNTNACLFEKPVKN